MKNIQELKEREEKLLKRIATKRLDAGEADGPMQSRYASGRVELESDIRLLEIKLQDVRNEIKEIEKDLTRKVKQG